MVIWRIEKMPVAQNGTKSGKDLAAYMRQILFSLQSYSNGQNSVEVAFSHATREEIQVYFILRHVFTECIASTIEMQMSAANYQFERLDAQAAAVVSQQLLAMACAGLNAVVKTEKIVTTPFMQEGYYYWADALLSEEGGEVDNFNMLFQTLQKCDHSFISFQIIPTFMQNYEIDVLQVLNAHLEQHIRNAFPNAYGVSMYEPYARPAYDAYLHYIEKRGQPIYQYNIVVGSESGNSSFIANQIIAWLKAQTRNAPELQTFQVCVDRNRATYEAFPSYLSELLQHQYRDRFIWGGGILQPTALFRFPYLVTAEEALVFFRMPCDDGKIVGIESTAYQSSNELLSKEVTDTNNIIIGKTVQSSEISIGIPPEILAQHALIVGMPGTGKTTFCINLLLQLYRKGIPFLAIEPTKAEYRSMMDVIPDLQVFTPGKQVLSPFILNPFVPPKGINIENYRPSLFNAFQAAFSMPAPLDVIFKKAIRTAYIRYGWRDYSTAGSPGTKPFGFHEFILVFKQIIDESDYSREVKGNLRSGGVNRLLDIIEQNSNIFDTINTIPIEDILTRPTVLELNAIDNIEQKALIIALLLIRIAIYTKNSTEAATGLTNAILIDEAHVLLEQQGSGRGDDKPDAQGYASNFVANLIAEIRAYGTSIIISDQRPRAVGEAIVANTDIKISFRLTEKNQKDIISNSCDMDDNMYQQLSQLDKGQAFAYYHKLKKPQMVITADVRAQERIRKEISDEEIREKTHYWDDKMYLLKPYPLCRYCNCGVGCYYKLRADAEYYCNLIWDREQKNISDTERLQKRIYGVPILLKSSLESYPSKERIALINCIRIALQRKAAIEKNLILSDNQVRHAIQTNLDEVINNDR